MDHGTLGILIPPSVILVIYAIYTEQSIGTMFVAAVVPGLLATAGYMLVVNILARLRPADAPAAERMPWRERLRATADVWPVVLVFVLVVTGMYDGWFSATEGAAIGAAATGLLAVTLGGMRWEGLKESLLSTTITTGLIFIVLLGAELFSAALALSRLPADLSAMVAALPVPPLVILLVILLIYFLLGCFMESLAMVLLTLPIFVPLMLSLDFGLDRTQVLVWFGILVLMSVEVGMISPPFGLNLFVINAMAKDVPMGETYRGVMGFVASDFARILLLALLPAISLWLPGLW
ncbi:TRAP transporter large permease subunit [Leptolyngbya sp. 15MV]|nr:TRAP transporter large permease subunit [Leptolyngbya sp. 15MV]